MAPVSDGRTNESRVFPRERKTPPSACKLGPPLQRGQGPGGGEGDGDGGALARAAHDLHRAAMHLDETLRDRQAETGAAIAPRRRRMRLAEGLAGAGDLLLAHADAGIAHLDDRA